MEEVTTTVSPVRLAVQTPLRAALVNDGYSQKWLADQLGVDPSQVSNWCRGIHVPGPHTRARIARTLGRRDDELWPEMGQIA